MRIKISITVLLAALLVLGACNGSGTTVLDTSDQLDGLDPVVSSAPYILADSGTASVSELITYRMPGIDGDVVESSAVVFVPQGPAPQGGFPVVAWGHGTTGVADRCAPSATNDLAGYAAYLDLYVQNGYAVVAPDYEGLGGSGLHPYLHLASEGRSLIYAVNAAAQQYPELSEQYVAVGHSQGGHAALGAGEYASEAGEVTLVGVVAIAPASNLRAQNEILTAIVTDELRAMADRVAAATKQLLYSALVLNGVSAANTDFNVGSVYGNNGTTLLGSLETDCVGGIQDVLVSSVSGPLFISNSVDSIISSDVIDLPEVAQYIAENEPGTITTDKPVLLLQGLLDETVLPESTRQLSGQLLQNNAISPILEEYPTDNHGSIVGASANSILNFLSGLF